MTRRGFGLAGLTTLFGSSIARAQTWFGNRPYGAPQALLAIDDAGVVQTPVGSIALVDKISGDLVALEVYDGKLVVGPLPAEEKVGMLKRHNAPRAL